MGRGNVLTHHQYAQLSAWLDKLREWAATSTAQKCAVAATEALGFVVSEANVLGAKRNLGISKPQPLAHHHATRCDVRVLAAALVLLYRQAGAAPPRAVLDLAGEKRAAVPALPFEVAG